MGKNAPIIFRKRIKRSCLMKINVLIKTIISTVIVFYICQVVE